MNITAMDGFDGPLGRAYLLLGAEVMKALKEARVIIFGLGGVGSWAAECLARTGVGHLTLVDDDIIVPSNINRQREATPLTVGQPKADTLADILRTLAPKCEIKAANGRYTAETAPSFDLGQYDYVIDAIDSVADKAHLILECTALRDTTLFSSMGAAMRIQSAKVRQGRFYDIQGDGLARALRQRFKRLGQRPKPFTCVYSTEVPLTPLVPGAKGSLCNVTATFGMRLASLVINDIYTRCQG